MHRILGLLVLALVVGLAPAMADLKPLGLPIEVGSWAQRFLADTGTYDRIEIQWVSGFGDGFEAPAFREFSDPAWQITADSTATSAAASGPSHTKDLQFNIVFLAGITVPGVFHFSALNGTSQVDFAKATWTGSNWSIEAAPGTGVAVAPEPTALLLFGLMAPLGLGIPKLLRRI